MQNPILINPLIHFSFANTAQKQNNAKNLSIAVNHLGFGFK